MAEPPRIGLVANPEKRGGSDLLTELVAELNKNGVDPVLEESTARQLEDTSAGGVAIGKLADLSDMILILGGDGTLLWVLRHLGESVKPLAAINTGRLGFLTCATADDATGLVHALIAGNFKISRRGIVEAKLQIEGGEWKEFHGLNEISIVRGSNSRVVHVGAKVNGSELTNYTGDGLIVATPTGSTAYSLSAGGPVIEPDAEVLAITPICPHAIANRPMVVSDRSRIDLRIPEQRDELLLMVDGQLVALIDRPAEIRVQRSKIELPLVTLPDYSFYRVLHQKLGWTGSVISNGEGDS